MCSEYMWYTVSGMKHRVSGVRHAMSDMFQAVSGCGEQCGVSGEMCVVQLVEFTEGAQCAVRTVCSELSVECAVVSSEYCAVCGEY